MRFAQRKADCCACHIKADRTISCSPTAITRTRTSTRLLRKLILTHEAVKFNAPHQPVVAGDISCSSGPTTTRLDVIVMPQECGMVQVNLFGGPMDGDSVTLSPAGSVGPPQQLCYMGAAKDQAAWMVYEAENVFKPGWPAENEHWRFNFVGWYSLGKGERLSA